jgi:ketosteroid isomerase-like protein
MSQENVEIVRRSFDQFAREGLGSVLGYFDSEIEWTTTDGYLEAATYRGHEGIRRYFETLTGEFENVRMEADELIDAGDHVLVCVRMSGRGKASGADVELTLTSVCSLREGKFVRIRNYPDKAEALEAVGLAG